MKKLAFVIPWYSDTMGGGAETAARSSPSRGETV